MTDCRPRERVAAEPPRAPATGIAQVVELHAAEHCWESSPGVVLHGYGFNGQVPGPTIEAMAGDTLAVRFTNLLPEPSSIHWHGLRVPASVNGSAAEPVQPGNSIDHRFDLPDAGTFWYRSYLQKPPQAERGLYGALVVRSPEEARFDGERVLIFEGSAFDPLGLTTGTSCSQANRGQLENEKPVVLVNGASQPQMEMDAHHIERWRLVNAASADYLRLSLDGRPFSVIGNSGGMFPAPVSVEDVLMAPGDRLDLAVGPFTDGQSLGLIGLSYDRAPGRKPHKLATLHVTRRPQLSGTARTAEVDLNRIRRPIRPLASRATEPTRTIRLRGRSARAAQDHLESKEELPDALTRIGELQVWDIVNENSIDHPFYLRGFFFQIMEINGYPPHYLSWQDTTTVPAGGRIRIAWVPDDRPGRWTYQHLCLGYPSAWTVGYFDVVP